MNNLLAFSPIQAVMNISLKYLSPFSMSLVKACLIWFNMDTYLSLPIISYICAYIPIKDPRRLYPSRFDFMKIVRYYIFMMDMYDHGGSIPLECSLKTGDYYLKNIDFNAYFIIFRKEPGNQLFKP